MNKIDFYIEEIKNKKINGGERRTKVYPFSEDGVILVNKSEKDFDILKTRIKRCLDLKVNIPEYFDYKYDIENEEYYILEELATGKALDELLNNENGQNIVNSIPYHHIEKYIKDSYLLENNGIGCEPRRRNIFYDENRGFTIIDVAALKDDKDNNDSLEKTSCFFDMYSYVLLLPFSNDEQGQLIKEKTVLNMVKAFENGHPNFKKYSRFIYRKDSVYSSILEKNGINLTLNEIESRELEEYINKLIKDIVESKVSNKEDLFTNTKSGYIELLSSSIDYCINFKLFNKDEVKLNDYIYEQVYSEIKRMFISSPNDNNLKELFYKIRKKELDPFNVYPEEIINDTIYKEIEEILNSDKENNSTISK